jgi:hypothetical protein
MRRQREGKKDSKIIISHILDSKNFLSFWRKSKKSFSCWKSPQQIFSSHICEKKETRNFLIYSQKHNIFHSQSKNDFFAYYFLIFSSYSKTAQIDKMRKILLEKKSHFSLILYFNASSLQYIFCVVSRCVENF